MPQVQLVNYTSFLPRSVQRLPHRRHRQWNVHCDGLVSRERYACCAADLLQEIDALELLGTEQICLHAVDLLWRASRTIRPKFEESIGSDRGAHRKRSTFLLVLQHVRFTKSKHVVFSDTKQICLRAADFGSEIDSDAD